MKRCRGAFLLFSIFCLCLLGYGHFAHASSAGSALPIVADTIVTKEKVMEDTLREVVIEGKKELPVMDQFRRDVGRSDQPHARSLGDVIEKVAPGLQDKMLHPFAIKERKHERKKKRVAKILDDYDKVESSNSALDEVIRRQREEDERNGMTNWQQLDKDK